VTARTARSSDRMSAARRARELDAVAGGRTVDVLVVGGGVTGAGVALDAASRGLSVALLERGDLAAGTSRWSSKLAHGGLRYLATGDVGLAWESARERHLLATRTAPHLVRALPMLLPSMPALARRDRWMAAAGFSVGDGLRAAARTPAGIVPRARRVGCEEALRLVPALRRSGLQGGRVHWDGQLEDDARLVVALARTAASYGASILTHVEVTSLSGAGATARDRLTGRTLSVSARAVVNATGVWADTLATGVTLRPSKGAHLVLDAATLGHPQAAVTLPVPGESNRYVFAIPHPDGHVLVGLTDTPLSGDVPDVPAVDDADERFLLDVLNGALDTPVTSDDVVGRFAGLRPLLDGGDGATADLSRRHRLFQGPDGVLTLVGGKLTTYRRMAQDAVDLLVAGGRLPAPRCRTTRLPLVGAAPRAQLDRLAAPARLVRRYGTEAPDVAALAAGEPRLLQPVAPGSPVLGVELAFGVLAEGAVTPADLLDGRLRLDLRPARRAELADAAQRALERWGVVEPRVQG
jgi:glycerol-3-phosphate dehydrogenase